MRVTEEVLPRLLEVNKGKIVSLFQGPRSGFSSGGGGGGPGAFSPGKKLKFFKSSEKARNVSKIANNNENFRLSDRNKTTSYKLNPARTTGLECRESLFIQARFTGLTRFNTVIWYTVHMRNLDRDKTKQFHATLCHFMLRCTRNRDLRLHRLDVCQTITHTKLCYLMLRC